MEQKRGTPKKLCILPSGCKKLNILTLNQLNSKKTNGTAEFHHQMG